jgi:hypothetical protein
MNEIETAGCEADLPGTVIAVTGAVVRVAIG